MPSENSIYKLDSFVLCQEKTDRVQISVWAEITDRCLKISGQDLGAAVVDHFGDDEYKYFYNFSEENTVLLISLLTDNLHDFKDIFIQRFNGTNGIRCLTEFCQANDIAFQFYCC